ncbi:uncharacterized protein N7500_008894 [Penicillium coprophilum]|uniref:uncharacterized protein n=1 Tax=Penicillium coprophilum TaxID=36646 RepID=UPI00238A372A|nr:uncharacterized protein N7500_008894 [Penicillium coprophilum]KAJ5159243.1 hypothetical protein N7500_008894 [Penicillium coprophilum]
MEMDQNISHTVAHCGTQFFICSDKLRSGASSQSFSPMNQRDPSDRHSYLPRWWGIAPGD